MGKFETVKTQGVKSYTLINKKSYRSVLGVESKLSLYSFVPTQGKSSVEVFFDTANNLISSAGIILSKVVEGDKAYFKVEREELVRYTKIKTEKKVFIQPAGVKDSIQDHSLFLIDGISSMYSTKFNIDLENVLKSVEPRIQIETVATCFKILSGTKFKGLMSLENVRMRNFQTRKKAETNMLRVEKEDSLQTLEGFDEFVGSLEKHCKEIIETQDTKYQIATRLTKK